MASSSELDLVRRLGEDDPTALEDAYSLFAARCNAVAYRILQDHARAEDAVQEAFLSLWRHRKGLVVRTAGLAPWLVVVTRNAALATVRSESRRTARENRTGADERAVDPAEIATSNTMATQVRTALRELPEEQQKVIELAYYRFMTMAQIAERTGSPIGTVKRRAQLALQRLARTMRTQDQ